MEIWPFKIDFNSGILEEISLIIVISLSLFKKLNKSKDKRGKRQ